jgi:hypothetical protein
MTKKWAIIVHNFKKGTDRDTYVAQNHRSNEWTVELVTLQS